MACFGRRGGVDGAASKAIGIPGYDFSLAGGDRLSDALVPGLDTAPVTYAEELTSLVFYSLAHGSATELRPDHSWFSWLLSQVWLPSAIQTQNPIRIVESGSAICSQSAFVIVSIARADGVPARIVAYEGHVIAELFINDSWRILDGDYGITAQISADELGDKKNQPIVQGLLAARGSTKRLSYVTWKLCRRLRVLRGPCGLQMNQECMPLSELR